MTVRCVMIIFPAVVLMCFTGTNYSCANRFVTPACLPFSVPVPRDGERCWVTGWGHLYAGGTKPKYLQQVAVPIVSQARCFKSYPKQLDSQSMICAGMDHGGFDSCQGDSGGPMVCLTDGKFYLQGVVSWGKGCAQPKQFGVYAKVKNFLSWIDEITN